MGVWITGADLTATPPPTPTPLVPGSPPGGGLPTRSRGGYSSPDAILAEDEEIFAIIAAFLEIDHGCS